MHAKTSAPALRHHPGLSRRDQGRKPEVPTGPKEPAGAVGTGTHRGMEFVDGFDDSAVERAAAQRARDLTGARDPRHTSMRAQAGAPVRDLRSTVPDDLMGQVLAGLAGAGTMAARRPRSPRPVNNVDNPESATSGAR